jgi:hypothetical protein
MMASMTLAMAMLAPAAAATPAQPTQAQPPAAASQRASDTACSEPSADSNTIVICTERPQGYRLDPDVLEARREPHSGGRPVRPGGKVIPNCATGVGPAPCMVGGVSLIGVALTAAEMAKRVATGEEVGSMFKTDPNPTEFQLYLMAKERRESEEIEKAATEAKANAAARQKQETGEAADAQPPGTSRD